MSRLATVGPMTAEEFLALPDDGVERDLIFGVVREEPMTRRNRHHSGTEARIALILGIWLDTQPGPRGVIVSGEAGFRLSRELDSMVGIDVAYVSAKIAAVDPESAYFDGPPVLAVEILSPSDLQEKVDGKVSLYLKAEVPLVWVVNPRFRTVTVFRPDAPPTLFNDQQQIEGGPHLPGFRVDVARLFGA